ncbi:MAG: transcriptional repressor LexA [Anaerolineales bacterium]
MMTRKRKPGLSDRQKSVLNVLEAFYRENGYPPTIREICDAAGISSTSVVDYYIKQLVEKGYIEREENISRGIRIVRSVDGEPFSLVERAREVVDAVTEVLRIPKLGRIVASAPAPVPSSDFNYFDAESMVDVARSLLPAREKGDDLFALEVQGDSMIDAMVNDGDLVIMKPASEARNGEMVAVWLDDRDETTLKYFYRENGRIRLQPANPTMGPIYVENPAAVRIMGKVVMVIRQLPYTGRAN